MIFRALESLPSKFDIKKTSYNIKKHEWQGDGQTAIVTQVEESMKKSKTRHPICHFYFRYYARKFNFKGKKNVGKVSQYMWNPSNKYFKSNCKYGHKVED